MISAARGEKVSTLVMQSSRSIPVRSSSAVSTKSDPIETVSLHATPGHVKGGPALRIANGGLAPCPRIPRRLSPFASLLLVGPSNPAGLTAQVRQRGRRLSAGEAVCRFLRPRWGLGCRLGGKLLALG